MADRLPNLDKLLIFDILILRYVDTSHILCDISKLRITPSCISNQLSIVDFLKIVLLSSTIL